MRLSRLFFTHYVLVLAFGTPCSGADDRAQSPELPPWPQWVIAKGNDFRTEPVANEEAEPWLRCVIPMPKHVDFQGKLVLPVTKVAVHLRDGATDVERNALEELEEIHLGKGRGKVSKGCFPILIGVSDVEGRIDGTGIPGAARLREVKNKDQAYLITPLSEPGLAVTGLTERGVYHGVKTLQQLLAGRLDQDRLAVPMVRVLDWPDLAERGLWGGSAVRDIQYLADRKMNLIEAHSQFWIDDEGRGRASIDTENQQKARLHRVAGCRHSQRHPADRDGCRQGACAPRH